jgi:hypothetical protein
MRTVGSHVVDTPILRERFATRAADDPASRVDELLMDMLLCGKLHIHIMLEHLEVDQPY